MRKCAGLGAVVLGIIGVGVFVTGCSSPPVYSEEPVQGVPPTAYNDKFAVGDTVQITFSGSSSDSLIKDSVEAIKEDGKITPPSLNAMVAAGKTPGQVQSELQTNYSKLFRNLTVTVQPMNRYYHVTGEVKKPGPEPYLGKTSFVQAISSAGDFTDFANRKKVRLTRADGKTLIINYDQIVEDPQLNVPVYPGDTIVVKRKIF